MDIWLLLSIVVYLSIGMGFALASWLQALENRLHKQFLRRDYEEEFKTFLLFTIGWWVIAIFCYKSEISKSIPTVKEYIENSQGKL